MNSGPVPSASIGSAKMASGLPGGSSGVSKVVEFRTRGSLGTLDERSVKAG